MVDKSSTVVDKETDSFRRPPCGGKDLPLNINLLFYWNVFMTENRCVGVVSDDDDDDDDDNVKSMTTQKLPLFNIINPNTVFTAQHLHL